MDPIICCLETEFDKEFIQKDRKSRESLLNGSLQIFLRIRPSTKEELNNRCSEFDIKIEDNRSVILEANIGSNTYKNLRINGNDYNKFKFYYTHVFDQYSSQKDLFMKAISKQAEKFVQGISSLLFTYGITNSGKTYTMQGNISNMGILPRFLATIFLSLGNKVCDASKLNSIEVPDSISETIISKENTLQSETMNRDSRLTSAVNSSVSSSLNLWKMVTDDIPRFKIPSKHKGSIYFLSISFVEIYNEAIFDLLKPANSDFKNIENKHARPRNTSNATKSILEKNVKRIPLQLGEDVNGNVYLKKLTEIYVTAIDQVMDYLKYGKKNLKMAATNLNYNSSRSHALFTIKLHRAQEYDPQVLIDSCEYTFCDLAGSERTLKTGNVGTRLREAININTSLLTLSKCLECLKYNQLHEDHPKIVPFRESKLTRLLQKYFMKRSQISMIVNISKAAPLFDETLHAMKFSALAKKVIINSSQPLQTTVNGRNTNYEKNTSKITNVGSTLAIDKKTFRRQVLADHVTIKLPLDPNIWMNCEGQTFDLESHDKELIEELKIAFDRYCEAIRQEGFKRENSLREHLGDVHTRMTKRRENDWKNYYETEMALTSNMFDMKINNLEKRCQEYKKFLELMGQFVDENTVTCLNAHFIKDTLDQGVIDSIKRELEGKKKMVQKPPSLLTKPCDNSYDTLYPGAISPFFKNGQNQGLTSTMCASPIISRRNKHSARAGSNVMDVLEDMETSVSTNTILPNTTSKSPHVPCSNTEIKPTPTSNVGRIPRSSRKKMNATKSVIKKRSQKLLADHTLKVLGAEVEAKHITFGNVSKKLGERKKHQTPTTAVVLQNKSSLLRFNQSPKLKPGQSYHSQCSGGSNGESTINSKKGYHKSNILVQSPLVAQNNAINDWKIPPPLEISSEEENDLSGKGSNIKGAAPSRRHHYNMRGGGLGCKNKKTIRKTGFKKTAVVGRRR